MTKPSTTKSESPGSRKPMNNPVSVKMTTDTATSAAQNKPEGSSAFLNASGSLRFRGSTSVTMIFHTSEKNCSMLDWFQGRSARSDTTEESTVAHWCQ